MISDTFLSILRQIKDTEKREGLDPGYIHKKIPENKINKFINKEST